MVQTPTNRNISSDALNIGVYSGDRNGNEQRGWITGDSMSNLLGFSTRRTSGAVTFRQSESHLSNANLVNISGLRKFLTFRQARLDEEARIRREREAAAEAARRAEAERKAEERRAILAASGFSSKGLSNEQLFANIFLGEFEALPFERSDASFSALYSAYLNSYSDRCYATLKQTGNAVDITEQVCVRWTENRYTGVRTACHEWETRKTGRIADREMYTGKYAVERAQLAKVVNPKSGGGLFGGVLEALVDLTNGKTLNDLGKAIDVSSDVSPFVVMNACSGPGVKRFQENLRRFAMNERPLQAPLQSERSQTPLVKMEPEKPATVVQKPRSTTKKTGTNARSKNRSNK